MVQEACMKRERPKFTAAFKDEAVRLALSGEKGLSKTARDLGLGDSTLYIWQLRIKLLNAQ